MFARLVLAAAIVAVGAPVAAAHGDVLVFTCGAKYANLCGSAPDGSGRTQLTKDATGVGNDVYASPSLSASGGKLAYLRAGRLYVLDTKTSRVTGPTGGPGQFLQARIRPDGGKVAVGEFGFGAGNAICTYRIDLSGRDCIGAGGSIGWTHAGAVYTSTTTAATGYRESVCVLLDPPPGLSGCQRFVPGDASADLYDATGSPDGKTIAVTRTAAGRFQGTIALYDATTGALVRVLTAGPNDETPSWSPDGRSLAFYRVGAGVMTVSAQASRPGTERVVARDGREPTWGGGSSGTASCTMPKLTGKRLSSAKAALKKAKCAAPTVKGSKRSRATVKKQSPAAGKRLAAARHPTLTMH